MFSITPKPPLVTEEKAERYALPFHRRDIADGGIPCCCVSDTVAPCPAGHSKPCVSVSCTWRYYFPLCHGIMVTGRFRYIRYGIMLLVTDGMVFAVAICMPDGGMRFAVANDVPLHGTRFECNDC